MGPKYRTEQGKGGLMTSSAEDEGPPTAEGPAGAMEEWNHLVLRCSWTILQSTQAQDSVFPNVVSRFQS